MTPNQSPFDDNPYAAPRAPALEVQAASSDRQGPPWEQQGPFATRLFRTISECFEGASGFFARMRREGGLWPPTLFCAIVTGVSAALGTLFESLVDGSLRDADLMGWVILGATMAFMPVLVVVILYAMAGMYHLMLVATGGAKHPFETTLRVAAYATACAAPLVILPFKLATLANAIMQIVFTVHGLKQAQEVGTAKAVTVVLLPIVVCVAAIIGLLIGFGDAFFEFVNSLEE